eukprot:5708166-Pleurochrysis_carterae.AAC.1
MLKATWTNQFVFDCCWMLRRNTKRSTRWEASILTTRGTKAKPTLRTGRRSKFYAPTQHQFDIPFQRRKPRNVVKSLDGVRKWQSKITGAMAAGHGLFCFVARCALGSGPNLVLTVLILNMIKICNDDTRACSLTLACTRPLCMYRPASTGTLMLVDAHTTSRRSHNRGWRVTIHGVSCPACQFLSSIVVVEPTEF